MLSALVEAVERDAKRYPGHPPSNYAPARYALKRRCCSRTDALAELGAFERAWEEARGREHAASYVPSPPVARFAV